MKNFFLFKWFKNISIAKKLFFTVGVMALLIGVELFALFFSIHTLSSVRAYVEGESLWSKAQKDASYHLLKYGVWQDEKDYEQFKEFMKVPLGDSKARKELIKKDPDLAVVRQGFIEGRNHPDDVNGMIKLFRRFHKISYINRAIYYWGEAEPAALKLIPIGDSLHNEINKASPSPEKINELLQKINPITDKITISEDNFSFSLAEGARWLENTILKLLFIIALTVEISGLLITISISRSMGKGLSDLIYATNSFAKGNLGARAKVFSLDEIGTLAYSFNKMSAKLAQSITELDQAQNKFKGLLESAPDAIVIMDNEGFIQLVNAQTEKLFGYERIDLLSQSISLLIVDGNKNSIIDQEKFFLKLSQMRRLVLDVYGRKKNGHEFPIEINFSPLQTEDGLLVSVAIRDISDRKYIKELERKNIELEQFVYIASHDLQEPLNTITSFISLIDEEYKGKLDNEGETYIDYIRESANRMTMLITDILEYSRIGRKSEFEVMDCNKIVNQVIDDMNATLVETNAKVVCDKLPTIKGYPIEIRLLFQNLLSNAVKFHKKNVSPSIKIYVCDENEYWHFTVEDNGIGIDEKHKDKIFVIFQRLHSTRKYDGTGIGLAHCKKIIELHHGKIWVESVENEGSKFHFTLPKLEENA
ncbi:MAG TPA: ATP-binding protein [Bacteroidia bacterium]|nr:ATP-binding protein [Bacteroidia bacterium]